MSGLALLSLLLAARPAAAADTCMPTSESGRCNAYRCAEAMLTAADGMIILADAQSHAQAGVLLGDVAADLDAVARESYQLKQSVDAFKTSLPAGEPQGQCTTDDCNCPQLGTECVDRMSSALNDIILKNAAVTGHVGRATTYCATHMANPQCANYAGIAIDRQQEQMLGIRAHREMLLNYSTGACAFTRCSAYPRFLDLARLAAQQSQHWIDVTGPSMCTRYPGACQPPSAAPAACRLVKDFSDSVQEWSEYLTGALVSGPHDASVACDRAVQKQATPDANLSKSFFEAVDALDDAVKKTNDSLRDWDTAARSCVNTVGQAPPPPAPVPAATPTGTSTGIATSYARPQPRRRPKKTDDDQ